MKDFYSKIEEATLSRQLEEELLMSHGRDTDHEEVRKKLEEWDVEMACAQINRYEEDQL